MHMHSYDVSHASPGHVISPTIDTADATASVAKGEPTHTHPNFPLLSLNSSFTPSSSTATNQIFPQPPSPVTMSPFGATFVATSTLPRTAFCTQRSSSTRLSPASRRVSHSSQRHVPRMGASVHVPDFFSTRWYNPSTSFSISQSSHHIPYIDSQPTDHHFVDMSNNTMCLIDLPASPSGQQSTSHEQILDFIRHRMHHVAQYSHEPIVDIRSILYSVTQNFNIPPAFSALITHTTNGVLRMAWLGACGIMVIRGEDIVYTTYQRAVPASILEHTFSLSIANSATPTTITARNKPYIYTDFTTLEADDLIICGSDGLFSNVSEKQILAFVRPVSDAEDSTLSIANGTCLGSWRYDEPQFISYYLASIAANFATATNSKPHLPFPFPPSPHADDVTVLIGACEWD